jgi:hypothetical protein
MFSVLCCTIYSCIYCCTLFIILCMLLPFIDIFHIQLSYDRYWIFWNTYVYVYPSWIFVIIQSEQAVFYIIIMQLSLCALQVLSKISLPSLSLTSVSRYGSTIVTTHWPLHVHTDHCTESKYLNTMKIVYTYLYMFTNPNPPWRTWLWSLWKSTVGICWSTLSYFWQYFFL